MKQDRFLIGILAGITLLVVVALALFFTRRGASNYTADDTVQGVLHNYVLALQKQDYQKAYSYLAKKPDKPSYDTFRQALLNGYVNPGQSGVEILDTTLNGDEAIVDLAVVYISNDPFSGGSYRSNGKALLIRQDGQWKIFEMPYNYWASDWYMPQPQSVPVKP